MSVSATRLATWEPWTARRDATQSPSYLAHGASKMAESSLTAKAGAMAASTASATMLTELDMRVTQANPVANKTGVTIASTTKAAARTPSLSSEMIAELDMRVTRESNPAIGRYTNQLVSETAPAPTPQTNIKA